MNVIQVWEHVLKWGLAQNPELPSNPTNFSKEDFKTLKNNIHQCIPFIKFHNLSSDEFSDKVLPFRKNNDSIENYVLSRVKYEEFAIYDSHNFGPAFGDCDLALTFKDRVFCYNSKYEMHIRKTVEEILVEEYEMFQITT
ncbi:BTB/POZ protein [Rhizophagus clarus]|uniref:BTB/POZ protein n=1 Tax=Rhizophagus clarus TaxID=94130 RepID=A0A8H3M6U8_9GLOM|nr:BTB/POZ protein [Rhizophagus clarus]